MKNYQEDRKNNLFLKSGVFGGEGSCEDNSVYSRTSLKEFKVDFWGERKCIQKLGISAVLHEYASESMVNCPSEAQSCCGLSKWHRGKSIAFPSHPVLADLAGKMQPWDILNPRGKSGLY